MLNISSYVAWNVSSLHYPACALYSPCPSSPLSFSLSPLFSLSFSPTLMADRYQVMGLAPNTSYQFSISAYNQIGNGPYSPHVNFSTAARMK
jgi:hypothetical protein